MQGIHDQGKAPIADAAKGPIAHATASCLTMTTPPAKHVLLMGEAVTLAHVGRPIVVARSLLADGARVTIATAERYRAWVEQEGATFVPIRCLAQSEFEQRLMAGRPVFQTQELVAAVDEDLALIRHLRPDTVIGDFRLSLGISTRLAGCRYLNLSNAYWSPAANLPPRLPDIPLRRLCGESLGQGLFSAVWPVASWWHARPFRACARRFGVPVDPGGLRAAYTGSDCTLYCDLARLYGLPERGPRHLFLGPLDWAPSTAPANTSWPAAPPSSPRVYLCLGSSGSTAALQTSIDALARTSMSVLVSTAGMAVNPVMSPRIALYPFVNGTRACAEADLVICNGGSPSTYQALLHGVPVIGIARNMDQFMNMSVLERAGVGRCLRASTLADDKLIETIEEVLEGNERTNARELGHELRGIDLATMLCSVI